jgi:heme-degrading monooxygenase HmoA
MINVFNVEPDNQQTLVELLVQTAQQIMSKQPGYRSARVLRSLDGTKVAVHAQWRTREDFEALAGNPEVAAHMRRVRALASFEPVLYQSVFTYPG